MTPGPKAGTRLLLGLRGLGAQCELPSEREQKEGELLFRSDTCLREVVLQVFYTSQGHNTFPFGRATTERFLGLVHDVWVERCLSARLLGGLFWQQ